MANRVCGVCGKPLSDKEQETIDFIEQALNNLGLNTNVPGKDVCDLCLIDNPRGKPRRK